MEHATLEALEAGVEEIRRSPSEAGTVELIVARPAVGEREELERGALDEGLGLAGDDWSRRETRSTPDRRPNVDAQVTLMNARVAAVVAGERERWALAGDQLYVDLDLGVSNLPAGARLAVGTAVLEVTELPHTGCVKFSQRFGKAALRFVNSEVGRALRLRGVNARVVVPGTVRRRDAIRKA